jgi:hypothetical protein
MADDLHQDEDAERLAQREARKAAEARLREQIAKDSPWWNLKRGAAYADRHPQTLAREIKAGRLRAARIGDRKEYFLLKEWIDDWMESQALVVPVRRRSF